MSLRMDWLDLFAIQGTLKSLLQQHSSKASIFWLSAFFMVHLSHPYMTIGKTIDLTRQTYVGIVMSLLFSMLFRFFVAFLPRSKCLLISWLQSPSAVILEPRKIKFVTVSSVSPSICHEVMELDAMILVFWMLSFKPPFPLSTYTFSKRLFSLTLKGPHCFQIKFKSLNLVYKNLHDLLISVLHCYLSLYVTGSLSVTTHFITYVSFFTYVLRILDKFPII